MPLFLDATGLSKLLQKIKTVFATKSELASSISDLDQTLVHSSGNETIAGTKTFSSTISGSVSGSSASCTGNAASATTLAIGAHKAMPAGNLDVDGIQAFGVYNDTGYPFNYGNVLNVQGSQFKGAGQLMLGWSGTTNGVANIYYRNKRDNQTTWSAWKTVSFTDGSSDERVKQDFGSIPDSVLDAWEQVHWTQFRLKKETMRSDNAPLHFGAVVQNIQKAFSDCDANLKDYALTYHEHLTEQDGNMPCEENPSLLLKDKWCLRYAEAFAIEAAYQRRRADRLEERLSALEKKVELLMS